jgi:hypothetical protein
VGRACAALPPSIVAIAVGATGLGAAALLSTSHVLLALALGAGLLEAMDGFHATRRHALIRAAPAFWALPVPRLARLRARLRPFSESEVKGPTRARDVFELNLARLSPPPRQPLLLTAFALAATLAAALVARGLTDESVAAGALRWLLW